MPEPLGARLRRRREERQIALSAIAERTKISVALLEGLERDDLSRWPSGIFRRAFVRAYAEAIGLDASEVVREFLERHPDPDEVVAIPVDGVAIQFDASTIDSTTGLNRLVDAAARGLGRFRRQRSANVLPSVIGLNDPTHGTHEFAPDPIVPDRDRPGSTGTADGGDAPRSTAAGTALPESEVSRVLAERDVPAGGEREWQPDLEAVARVCTDLGRTVDAAGFAALLGRVASGLGAAGVVLWVWESGTGKLWPALGHGYPDALLAHIPPLNGDDRNATAAAFRSREPSIVAGSADASGALAVPILAPEGCTGVLAIEFALGREQNATVRALATIVAAQISPLIAEPAPAEVARKLA